MKDGPEVRASVSWYQPYPSGAWIWRMETWGADLFWSALAFEVWKNGRRRLVDEGCGL